MTKYLVLVVALLFSGLTYASHNEVIKNYPNAQKEDWGVLSSVRAQCLRDMVDWKINDDIKLGRIRDAGNVLEANICGKELFDAYKSHAGSNKKGR